MSLIPHKTVETERGVCTRRWEPVLMELDPVAEVASVRTTSSRGTGFLSRLPRSCSICASENREFRAILLSRFSKGCRAHAGFATSSMSRVATCQPSDSFGSWKPDLAASISDVLSSCCSRPTRVLFALQEAGPISEVEAHICVSGSSTPAGKTPAKPDPEVTSALILLDLPKAFSVRFARNLPPYSILSTFEPICDGSIFREAATPSACVTRMQFRLTVMLLCKYVRKRSA
mmetsp:Transcript_33837/g.79087  ORF Transcript_33837/g.79087 Transcript_33837/m.79087 type:complete len:232 (+) Transcript_33837:804-1499(+)